MKAHSQEDRAGGSPSRGARTGFRWPLVPVILAGCVALVIWLVATEAPIIRFLVQLYRDKQFLKDAVASWGWLAPVVFMALQALQVIVAPFPGEITGPLGGALFGTTWGLAYSTIGLTLGTLCCFAIGRLWGEPLVRSWLSEHHWNRLNFIVQAEGAIICFMVYLIPGFPKDLTSYLFGISPISFGLFVMMSTLGRLPGTWISSYFGAHVAEQQYIYAVAFLALFVAPCLPLYLYRERIVGWLYRKRPGLQRTLTSG